MARCGPNLVELAAPLLSEPQLSPASMHRDQESWNVAPPRIACLMLCYRLPIGPTQRSWKPLPVGRESFR